IDRARIDFLVVGGWSVGVEVAPLRTAAGSDILQRHHTLPVRDDDCNENLHHVLTPILRLALDADGLGEEVTVCHGACPARVRLGPAREGRLPSSDARPIPLRPARAARGPGWPANRSFPLSATSPLATKS